MMYSRLAAVVLGQGLFEGPGGGDPGPDCGSSAGPTGRCTSSANSYCTPSSARLRFRLRRSDECVQAYAGGSLFGHRRPCGSRRRASPGRRGGGGRQGYLLARHPHAAYGRLRIEFASRVCRDEIGGEYMETRIGRLSMEPRTAVGRFVMHKIFRRPRDLGSIKYLLRFDDAAGKDARPGTAAAGGSSAGSTETSVPRRADAA